MLIKKLWKRIFFKKRGKIINKQVNKNEVEELRFQMNEYKFENDLSNCRKMRSEEIFKKKSILFFSFFIAPFALKLHDFSVHIEVSS